METFDIKTNIIDLLSENKDGVSMDNIIDYLDYINRVRYDINEIIPTINKLIEEKKIKKLERNKVTTYRLLSSLPIKSSSSGGDE